MSNGQTTTLLIWPQLERIKIFTITITGINSRWFNVSNAQIMFDNKRSYYWFRSQIIWYPDSYPYDDTENVSTHVSSRGWCWVFGVSLKVDGWYWDGGLGTNTVRYTHTGTVKRSHSSHWRRRDNRTLIHLLFIQEHTKEQEWKNRSSFDPLSFPFHSTLVTSLYPWLLFLWQYIYSMVKYSTVPYTEYGMVYKEGKRTGMKREREGGAHSIDLPYHTLYGIFNI